MPKRLTTKDFIEKAKQIHGDKYNYDKTVYTKAQERVIITCPIHGDFEQFAYAHLNGKGCKKCGTEKAASKCAMTTEQFIKKAKQIHENKYDYSKVKYINSVTPICIICPIHGEFWQKPKEHLNGNGCIQCYRDKQHELFSDSQQEFIEKAQKIHGNTYDYSKVNYFNNHTKVEIVCPIHGSFWQTPGHHKSGEGCPKCATLKKFSINFRNSIISKGEKTIIEWLKFNNITYEYDYPMEIYNIQIRVDFVINNIYIEYNGIQHYKFNSYFHKSELDFLKQQYRDQKLREYCKENNIKLIEIRYDQNVEDELEKIKPLLLKQEIINDE